MNKLITIIPTIIMIEMLLSSIPYFFVGKYGSGMYWLFAGLLSFAVIYLIPGE